MLRICTSIILFLVFSFSVDAQNNKPEDIIILYYNLDNLFDTSDDPGTADDEYLPGGIKAWDKDRYEKKIKGIAENISEASGGGQADIIGFAGLENKKVIDDIISERRLRRTDYSVIMPESEGAGTAFLVKKELMRIDETELLEIDSTFLTRDKGTAYEILYIKGELNGPGNCHFFVNRWPGLTGGGRSAEDARTGSAIAVRKKVDEILNFERDAKIIIMGTFYDEPTSRNILSVLNATNKRKNLHYRDLYNLFYDDHNINNRGTTMVNNMWQMWDQVIVSAALLNDRHDYYADFGSGMIYTADEKGDKISKPEGTYHDDKYIGGISSHLPVYCIIKKRE